MIVIHYASDTGGFCQNLSVHTKVKIRVQYYRFQVLAHTENLVAEKNNKYKIHFTKIKSYIRF